MTVKEATEYLRRNKDILKMNKVAKELGVAQAILNQVVNDSKDSGGYPVRLPMRAAVRLERLIKDRLSLPERQPKN